MRWTQWECNGIRKLECGGRKGEWKSIGHNLKGVFGRTSDEWQMTRVGSIETEKIRRLEGEKG
jgi:hypothetical protein